MYYDESYRVFFGFFVSPLFLSLTKNHMVHVSTQSEGCICHKRSSVKCVHIVIHRYCCFIYTKKNKILLLHIHIYYEREIERKRERGREAIVTCIF